MNVKTNYLKRYALSLPGAVELQQPWDAKEGDFVAFPDDSTEQMIFSFVYLQRDALYLGKELLCDVLPDDGSVDLEDLSWRMPEFLVKLPSPYPRQAMVKASELTVADCGKYVRFVTGADGAYVEGLLDAIGKNVVYVSGSPVEIGKETEVSLEQN